MTSTLSTSLCLVALAGAALACSGDSHSAEKAGDDTQDEQSASAQADPLRSAGCGKMPSLASGARKIDVSGTSRSYALLVPEDYDPDRAYPLIFEFHGTGANGQSQFALSGLSKLMDGIFVAPDGLAGKGLGALTTQFSAERDVPMFDALVEQLSAELCVDRGRIFASGMSIGGFWANELACLRGGTLRATAPVAGSLISTRCQGRVAVMQIHGEADTTTPFAQAKDSRQVWAAIGGCKLNEPRPGTIDACESYAGCVKGYPLEWCTHKGGHTWPDWASGVIAKFFTSLDSLDPDADVGEHDGAAAGKELSLTLSVPDTFRGPAKHMSVALYDAGTTLLAGAPIKTLADGLDVSGLAAGKRVDIHQAVLLGSLEKKTYRMTVFVYVTDSFPIPTFGTDYVAYRDVEIDPASDIAVDMPLTLQALPLVLPN